MLTKEQELELMVSKRIFPLVGVDIDSKTTTEMQRVFLRMLVMDAKTPAQLIIDCGGGDANLVLKVYDLIKALPFEVHCTVIGSCHSATLVLIAACTKRYATKHSRFLFHALKGGTPNIFSTEDGEEQIRARVAHQTTLVNQFFDIESSVFGIPKEKLKEMHIQGERYDVRLTAEDAVKNGIIHEIIEKVDFFKFSI